MILLACFGLMCIIKYGSILNIPRSFICRLHSKIDELFKCSLCLGFWIGIFVGAVEYKLHNNMLYFIPFISAGVCWFGDRSFTL